MVMCNDIGVKIDYISVSDRGCKFDPKYPAMIADIAPSAANWKFYEVAIIQDYQRRQLIKIGAKLQDIGKDDPVKFIADAEKDLLELATNNKTQSIKRICEIGAEAVNRIQERAKLNGKIPGLSTGLNALDLMTGGLQDDRLIILGARPSDGKSALALNMCWHIADREKQAVGLISAESSNVEICTRVISSEGHILGAKLMTGVLGGSDMQNLLEIGAKIKDVELYLYDTPNLKFSEMKSVARQMVTVNKCKVIFIDYIQIITWENQGLPRHEQVAEISKGIKQLARELKIPIVALAQLRRDAEGREPEMADLGDSSQLEKDADTLIFIHHPKVKEGEQEKSWLLVKKNRDGARGAVPVVFRREYVKFYEEERT
jgi:replicative DNA helicase